MKKWSVFLVIVSLIAGSLFSVLHSHAGSLSDDTVQIVQNLDDKSDNHGDSSFVECEQCCHAGCYVALSNRSSTDYISTSHKHFISSGEDYFSQLNSPPFQPPKV